MGVPPFVVIPEKDVSSEAGFLGPLYDPFVAGDPNTRNYSVRNLTLPLGISLDQARVRMQLLTALEGEFKKAEQFSLMKPKSLRPDFFARYQQRIRHERRARPKAVDRG